MKYFWLYLAAVNLLAFAAMRRDKRLAVKGKRRIPEARLIAYAAMGGSVGELAGMHLFRHKTKKNKFRIGVPAILIIQMLVAGAIKLYLCGIITI